MHAIDTATLIRTYYEAWTGKDFDTAAALLADDLVVEVPINDYPTAASFAAAVKSFGSMATTVELLAAMSGGDEAMLLYDMQVDGLGTLRVAEHFTVDAGKIVRVRQVHDTAPIRAIAATGLTGYRHRVTIRATRERVFDAIATVDGPRHWWTTLVGGSAESGGHLTFGFAGLDEQIVMHVDLREAPSLVCWSCTAHTRDNEWTGSSLRFELTEPASGACVLDFRHDGLSPELVANGWAHFLASLAAHAERGEGSPFGV